MSAKTKKQSVADTAVRNLNTAMNLAEHTVQDIPNGSGHLNDVIRAGREAVKLGSASDEKVKKSDSLIEGMLTDAAKN